MKTQLRNYTFLFLVLPLCLTCFSLWQLAERLDARDQDFRLQNTSLKQENDSLQVQLHQLEQHSHALEQQADSLRKLAGIDHRQTTQLKTNRHEALITIANSGADQLYRFFAGFDTTAADKP